jgi:hypothetical protein
MNFKRFIRYTLPVIPILCLGITLVVFAVTTNINPLLSRFDDTSSYQETITPGISSTGVSTQIPSSPTSQPAQPEVNLEKLDWVSTFRDISLIVATGIITLSSIYIGGYVQALIQREQEVRSERRSRTAEYKSYLTWLMKVCQRGDMIKRYDNLKDQFPSLRNHEISNKVMDEVFDKMPLAWELSGLEDDRSREAFDAALNACIDFIIDLREGNNPDHELVRKKCHQAIKTLDKYEAY